MREKVESLSFSPTTLFLLFLKKKKKAQWLHVRFDVLYLYEQEEIVQFLGTIFRGALIYICPRDI